MSADNPQHAGATSQFDTGSFREVRASTGALLGGAVRLSLSANWLAGNTPKPEDAQPADMNEALLRLPLSDVDAMKKKAQERWTVDRRLTILLS